MSNMRGTIDQVFIDFLPKLEPRGILHIGGQTGQEGKIYRTLTNNFIFVEPIPEYAQEIKRQGYKVIEKSVTGDGILFVSGRASSTLKPRQHKINKIIKIKVCLLNELESKKYDTLIIDVQGATLQVLKSGDLQYFEHIICEASNIPRYKNERTKQEIICYLFKRGYLLVAEYRHGNNDIYDLVFTRNLNFYKSLF